MRPVDPRASWPSSWHTVRKSSLLGPVLIAATLFGVGATTTLALASPTQSSALAEPRESHDKAAPRQAPKLEVGLGSSAVDRSSERRDIEYELGLRWSAHATIVVLEHLGLRLTGGMEYHDIEISRGALGVDGSVLGDPNLSGPHVMGQLQPMLEVLPRLDVYALLGVGWQRFTTDPMDVSEPTPLLAAERSGVIIELPFALGARYAVLKDRMAVALQLAFAAPISQTGTLFDRGAGASQGLRQDTGELVRLDALPNFQSAASAGVSVDFFFF